MDAFSTDKNERAKGTTKMRCCSSLLSLFQIFINAFNEQSQCCGNIYTEGHYVVK